MKLWTHERNDDAMLEHARSIFGLIEYSRVGPVSECKILWVRVYSRIADIRCLFGFGWRTHA